jgi:hypothetical protein
VKSYPRGLLAWRHSLLVGDDEMDRQQKVAMHRLKYLLVLIPHDPSVEAFTTKMLVESHDLT